MNAIDWSQVPKNARGQVDYAAITSLVARVMVAEEELTRLQAKLQRHYDAHDALRLSDHNLAKFHRLEARLIRRLEQWQGLLAQ